MMTNRTKFLIFGGILVAATAIIIFGNSLNSDSNSSVIEISETTPADYENEANNTRVTALSTDASASTGDKSAAQHHDAIRKNAKELSGFTKLWIDGQLPETTTEEMARLHQEDMERRLIDSMAALTEQIKNDPAYIKQALAMLEAETDPEIMLLLAQAIGEAAEALGDKFPSDMLLDMAEGNDNLERRRAALVAMAYLRNPPLEVQKRMADITQNAPTPELRIAAIEGMGSWGVNDPGMAQRVSEALLPAREASNDPHVRGIVIQTIGNLEQPLTPKLLQAMTDAIYNESDAMNRSRAALAFGTGIDSGNRSQVMSTLEQAYLTEKNLDTRRHIITQITKAARYDAEDYLARLPADHPQLAQDIEDYMQILASVDRSDWTQIWDQKSDLDHRRQTFPASSGGHGYEGQ